MRITLRLNSRGQSTLEYAVLAIILIAIVGSLSLLFNQTLQSPYGQLKTQMDGDAPAMVGATSGEGAGGEG